MWVCVCVFMCASRFIWIHTVHCIHTATHPKTMTKNPHFTLADIIIDKWFHIALYFTAKHIKQTVNGPVCFPFLIQQKSKWLVTFSSSWRRRFILLQLESHTYKAKWVSRSMAFWWAQNENWICVYTVIYPFIHPAIYLINNLSARNGINEEEKEQQEINCQSYILVFCFDDGIAGLCVHFKNEEKRFYDQLFWFPQNHSHNLCSIWNRYNA